jgi:hypothetical protein
MKWSPWLFGSLAAALIAGCGGDRRNNETGAASGAGSEPGAMQGGAATDTSMRAADTTATQPGAGAMRDTLKSGRDSASQ